MKLTKLLHKSDYVGARNNPENYQVEIQSTSKPLIPMNIKETVDLYEQYTTEYGACDKYRLTLTIKPYCSNVLFNASTEIEKTIDNGNSITVVSPTNSVDVGAIGGFTNVFGRNDTGLFRDYMVSNTEYSSPETGFIYHPGYDIFDNHTLRNLSFRPVMHCYTTSSSNREIFNTARDVMRNIDGREIKFWPRMSVEDGETVKINKHIYEHSNLLSFSDGSAIEANLRSENGWYGFYNASSIRQRYETKEGSGIYVNHIFSHTINNVGNCEFVDMYPDRTLFSLIPKVNKHRNRIERNWDVFLTYPWKNFYNHNLVKNVKTLDNERTGDGNTNGLAVMKVIRKKANTNRYYVFFRTFTKHGLNLNDKIVVYLSKNVGRTYNRLNRTYNVDYLGDINGNNKEYVFGISERSLLNDLFTDTIEDIFYDEVTQTAGCQTISGAMTDVPENNESPQTIEQNLYVLSEIQQPLYFDFNTYDEMPQTVRSNSNEHIRVWNGGYRKYKFNGDQYELTLMEGEFGDWNTYTDLPNEFTFNLIRVKTYDYYDKEQHFLHLKKVDDLYINVNDTINSVFYGNEDEAKWCVRIVRQAKGYDCQYYFRKFRKLPNFKYASEPLSASDSENEIKFLEYIEKNASNENGNMLNFESENYKLAFAKTLYGDDVMQITYLDSITIGKLKDNLGRPLTEIYATIVKRNKGYKLWYPDYGDVGDYSNPEIEYSHCFGSLTTGVEFGSSEEDYLFFTREYNGLMSSISNIHRNPVSGKETAPMTVEDWDDENIEKEITETDDVFYGDVVEYSPAESIEHVLSPCCFRFNTGQRERGSDEQYGIKYHELLYDDYDPDRDVQPERGFFVEDYEYVDAVKRREGYYYNPHTRIQLKRFSNEVKQGTHKRIIVKKATPLQAKSMLIKITTRTAHSLGVGQQLYIINNGIWWHTVVSDVIDMFTFTINPIPKNETELNGNVYVDWIKVCNGLNDGTYQLHKVNKDIPSYAKMLNNNLFVWRNIEGPADFTENDELHFPMSNNALYVDVLIDLILRRQDPEGRNGLLYNGSCPDVVGRIQKESNYEYVPEIENQC